MRYVTTKRLAEATGYTEKALRHKVDRGVFAEGIHYRRAPDGRLLFDVEEFEKWVEGETRQGSRG